MTARGIRNFNPGNIKDVGIPWDGIAAWSDRTEEQKNESTFVVFRAPWWGIRAMAVILSNYATRHGLKTVQEIIGRWAPVSDNNPTSGYAWYVADQMKVEVNQVIDIGAFQTMRDLVQAMIQFENGEDPYSWEYEVGLILAGIEPEQVT